MKERHAFYRACEWLIDHSKLKFLPALPFGTWLLICYGAMVAVVAHLVGARVLGWWAFSDDLSNFLILVFVLLALTPLDRGPPTPEPPRYNPGISHAENARRMLAWVEATPHLGHPPDMAPGLRRIIELAEEEEEGGEP